MTEPTAPGSARTPLLSVSGLEVRYGVIRAVHDVSLDVYAGETVCLIGANGAGKSTLLKAIAGLLKPNAGNICFNDTPLLEYPPHQRVGRGLALVPEGRGIFSAMSVTENLLMGGYHRRHDRTGIAQDLEHVFELFPRLAERHAQTAGTLSGGEQQMLAIGRALLSRPQLLLLDEPGMGLAPLLAQKIFDVIQKINREGVSLLLVEQNANAALAFSHRGYVMENGTLTLHGDAESLRHNPKVQEAYLGAG